MRTISIPVGVVIVLIGGCAAASCLRHPMMHIAQLNSRMRQLLLILMPRRFMVRWTAQHLLAASANLPSDFGQSRIAGYRKAGALAEDLHRQAALARQLILIIPDLHDG